MAGFPTLPFLSHNNDSQGQMVKVIGRGLGTEKIIYLFKQHVCHLQNSLSENEVMDIGLLSILSNRQNEAVFF